MDADTLLANWGFTRNPFRVYVAEKESDTRDIFIEPPYFRDILGNAAAPNSALVFGRRGDGKSTLCKMVEHRFAVDLSQATPLLIKYKDFPKWQEEDIRNLTIDRHIERIIGLGLEAFVRRVENEIELLQRLSKSE